MLTRLQMFGLIDAFELDMRQVAERYLLGEMTEEELLGASYEETARRRLQDDPDNSSPITNFLDIRPAYDLLNRSRDLLPEAFAREVRANTPQLDAIVPIRNRVMHGRPLRLGDAESLDSALDAFTTRWWSRLQLAQNALQLDPSWVPERAFEPLIGAVLHNLPLPEYDETGLLGRDELVGRVVQVLKRGRDSVLTPAGEGGIGKTAVAVAAAHELAADPDLPYELILWASFKSERLTARGVEQLDGAIRSMTGGVEVLRRSLDDSSDTSLESLAGALDGIKCLLVLDNLESVGGEEFVELYETLPESVHYLVTSRQGIGQIERRLVVGPLDERAGLLLLNQLLKARAVSVLGKISGDSRREIVRTLRFSPLGIRWFVLAVEAGRDPAELLRHQDELLDFCVRSVHSVLSPEARLVLSSLEALGRPVALDDLVVLTGEAVASLMSGLQELTKGSLVVTSLSPARATVSLFALTETARRYVATRTDASDEVRLRVLEAENRFRLDEERRAADLSKRSLAPVVVRTRTELDAATAQLLRRAMLRSQARDAEGAYAIIREARSLNPDFWEVDRVEAFVRAVNGDHAIASKLYLDAYSAADGEEHRAIVAHFFAGHLARNVRDLGRAETLATEAHASLASAETAIGLGTILVWANKFTEALPLLHWAVTESAGKTQLIALTTLVEGYRRYSEYTLAESRNPVLAQEYAQQGLLLGLQAAEAGVRDRRLVDSLGETLTQVIRAARDADNPEVLPASLAERMHASSALFRKASRWAMLRQELLRVPMTADWAVAVLGGEPELSGQTVDEAMWGQEAEVAAAAAGWSVGTICNLERGYGFLAHEDYPRNVFFPASSVKGGHFQALVVGDRVWFQGNEAEPDRVRADAVWLSPPGDASHGPGRSARARVGSAEEHALLEEQPGRIFEGIVLDEGAKRFCFVRVPSFSADIICHESACPAGVFESLQTGDKVFVRLRATLDGRFQVAALAQNGAALT